jgi:PAS domain S-box-containing protein
MQSVADRWYIFYNRVSLGIAILFAGLAGVSLFVPGFENLGKAYGLSYTLFALAIIHILYVTFLYRYILHHQSRWHATIIPAVINALGILSLMQATDGLHSFYMALWFLIMIFSGMFGTYTVVGAASLMVAYFVVMTSGAFADIYQFTPTSFLPLVGTAILAVASHYLWRHSYTTHENQKVAQLSGMLKSNQQQAEILIQSLADGVIVFNTEGKITLMNPVAATMTEWPIEEGTGIDVQAVVKLKNENGNELEDGENPLKSVFEQRAATNATLQLVGRDNKQIVVSLVVSPVIPKSGELTGAVAVIRDVSAAHKEEKQRADFISTASHEMRTPVAAIEGYLALALNDKVSKIDPKARGFLEKAHESTRHLGQLFQDLLTSAKAEDGRLVSHPVVVEMGSYIEQLTDSFRFSAQKKGLLTEFVIGTGGGDAAAPAQSTAGEHVVRPLYYVLADPDRLREVITNLFDNAVKYTPTGKVSLGITGNNEVVQLFVRDTGPGIPAEDIPHLFQKFYRVDNSSTRTIGGTGLGLFISRKIVELYKGRVWVESQVDKGSTFYINLPRLTTQKAMELQNQQSQNQLPAAPSASLDSPV